MLFMLASKEEKVVISNNIKTITTCCHITWIVKGNFNDIANNNEKVGGNVVYI